MDNLIDGAFVIEKSEVKSYGTVNFEDMESVEIRQLAICRYEGDKAFYLFACDSDGNVVGDTVHQTIEEAKAFASNYYDVPQIKWMIM